MRGGGGFVAGGVDGGEGLVCVDAGEFGEDKGGEGGGGAGSE